jgi:serine/threonine protein kinase/Tfp pilus assembly protein PilF
MGAVYRAEDAKLGREVAIKVLSEEFARDRDRLSRFQREAKSLATLNHPNIVTIYSVEETDGLHFLTMELVEGKPLGDLIPATGFSGQELLDVALPLVGALAAAHAKGIIHRDLKPANVMVGDEGEVKILDFGLAKLQPTEALTEELHDLPTLTMTRVGTVMGTAPYMSPEQIEATDVDHRTDIFSLGILLYEMATGERPFQGGSSAAVVSSILRDAPRRVTEIKADLPEPLAVIVGRCLEKSPEDRYQKATEVLADLQDLEQGVASGEMIPSSRPSTGPSLLSMRSATILAVVVILAVIVGIAVWQARLPEPEALAPKIASLAVLPLKNYSGDPEQDYFVDGMTEALITDLSKIGALKVISRTSAMRYRGSDKPLPEIAAELGVDALVEGSVVREADKVGIRANLIEASSDSNLWAGDYTRDLTSILTLQGEVARAIAREIQVTLTPGEEALLTRDREVDPEAYEAYLKGLYHSYKLTPGDLEAARRYFERALEKDPDYAPAHGGLAGYWAGRQQMGLARPSEAGPKAKAAAQRAVELDDSVAEAHYALAVVRTWTDWDWEGAETAFRRAIELKPNFAELRAYYSHYLLITRRPEEAIVQMERALELDPYNVLTQGLNGMVLEDTDRCEEALEIYLNILETVPNHPIALGGPVRAYYCLGMYEETYAAAVANWTARGRPDAVAALEAGYAEGGFTGAMSGLAQWKVEQRASLGLLSCFGATFNFAAAGETREALDCLELDFEQHSPNMPYIGVQQELKSLRHEPRFQDLLRRMNLPLQPLKAAEL